MLYDKDNYTTTHLNRIKELIKKAGLIRGKRSYGFNWYWKKLPKRYPWRINWEGVDAVF